MTTITDSATPRLGRGVAVAVADTLTVTKRNLLHLVRQPQLIVFLVIQPIMFVLLFTYVFGGAIQVPNGSYVDFLIPGIIVQSVTFGTSNTSIGLAEDLTKGIIDRFRSLPMARSAVLAGRTIADTLRVAFTVLLMTGIGMLVGFRIHTSVTAALGAFALAVLFGGAFTLIAATIGLSVRDPETAQSAGFIWLFPLTFASSVFVPVESMPSWLQAFAERNPITVIADTLRTLVLGGPVGDLVWQTLAWTAAIVAVFAPIAVRTYRRVA